MGSRRQQVQEGERRTEYMPLADIHEAVSNAKRHHAEGIRASVSRFGVIDIPVLDERTGRLIAGHGRREDLIARKERGEQPPEGVKLRDDGEWLVPVSRGWASRSDDEAQAAAAALNRLTELGGWDESQVDALLAEIGRTDRELALLTGFDEARLDEALSALADAEPMVHDAVPATDAAWAETDEEHAAREERVGNYAARGPNVPGFTEVILVYSLEDRDRLNELIAVARRRHGGEEIRGAQVILMAMEAYVAALGSTEPAASSTE